MIDLVVFRRWKDCGSIIALFPEIPADTCGYFCEAYETVGQHGGADYYGVIQQTTPVATEDAADLAVELTRIGYRLRPIRRTSYTHHERRRQAARREIPRPLTNKRSWQGALKWPFVSCLTPPENTSGKCSTTTWRRSGSSVPPWNLSPDTH